MITSLGAVLLFYLMALVATVAAVGVVFSKQPLRSALSLIACLASLAVIYVLAEASFVAAMQILVYAGAIMVLFVFVIMLLNLQPEERASSIRHVVTRGLGGLAAVWFVVELVRQGTRPTEVTTAVPATVSAIGRMLLTDYLFAFEAISIMLLVAVVGAVVLGLRRLT